MTEEKTPGMIACPECFEPLPVADPIVQIKHMKRHPQVSVWHLDEIGLYKAADQLLREIKKKSKRQA